MSELPKSDKPINPIHTTDELAKLAGGKNSLTLPKSDKSINPILIVVFQVRRFLRIWEVPVFEEKAKENQGTRNDLNATTEIFHKWCVQKREYML